METVIFRGKLPDSIHPFNSDLIQDLHNYNMNVGVENLETAGLVFGPLHEKCEITGDLTCIGMVVSGVDVLNKITLPARLKAAFTVKRLEASEHKGQPITVSRVNIKSASDHKRHKAFLMTKKGVSEKEATETVKKMKREAQKKTIGMPHFQYINRSKGIDQPIYTNAENTEHQTHKAKNTLGMGLTVFHSRIIAENGKLMLIQ